MKYGAEMAAAFQPRCREELGRGGLFAVLRLRHALRTLAARRGFPLSAVLALALAV